MLFPVGRRGTRRGIKHFLHPLLLEHPQKQAYIQLFVVGKLAFFIQNRKVLLHSADAELGEIKCVT